MKWIYIVLLLIFWFCGYAQVQCGPFCETEDIILGPTTCRDNLGSTTYFYGTSDGTVDQSNGLVTIPSGTLGTGSHIVVVSCVCLDTNCSSMVSYEFDIPAPPILQCEYRTSPTGPWIQGCDTEPICQDDFFEARLTPVGTVTCDAQYLGDFYTPDANGVVNLTGLLGPVPATMNWVLCKDINGCDVPFTSMTINTESLNVSISTLGNTDICKGNTTAGAVNAFGSGSQGYNYILSADGISLFSGFSASGDFPFTTAAAVWDNVCGLDIELCYNVTDVETGCTAEDCTIANINDYDVGFVPSVIPSICQGESNVLTASIRNACGNTSGHTFEWFTEDLQGNKTTVGTGSTFNTDVLAIQSNILLCAESTDAFGCVRASCEQTEVVNCGCDCQVVVTNTANPCELSIDFTGTDCSTLYTNVNIVYAGNGAAPGGQSAFPESFCGLTTITPGVDIVLDLNGCPDGDGWYGIQLSGSTAPCVNQSFGFVNIAGCTQPCDPLPTVIAPADQDVCWPIDQFFTYTEGDEFFISGCDNFTGVVTAPSGCTRTVTSSGTFSLGPNACDEYGTFTIQMTCTSGNCDGITFSDTWTITEDCTPTSCTCPSFTFPDRTWCSADGSYFFDPTPFGNYGDCTSFADLWSKNDNLTDLNTIVEIDGPGTYCYEVACTPEGCSQCTTSHCFNVTTQCNCNSNLTLTSNGCNLTASVTNCPNANYVFISPNGTQFNNGSSANFTATSSGNWAVSVTGCTDCGNMTAIVSVNCTVAPTCNCTGNDAPFAAYNNATCQIQISENCSDYTWSIIKRTNGCNNNGTQTILFNQSGSFNWSVPDNGSYFVIFSPVSGSGCSTITEPCFEFTNCDPVDCDCTLSMSLSNCILNWSFSGTGCANYETRYIDGPAGVSNIAISGNSGSNAVNVDGLYSLKGEDNSGGTDCPAKQWNVNVSGCEACDPTLTVTGIISSFACSAGNATIRPRISVECGDCCTGSATLTNIVINDLNGNVTINYPNTSINCGGSFTFPDVQNDVCDNNAGDTWTMTYDVINAGCTTFSGTITLVLSSTNLSSCCSNNLPEELSFTALPNEIKGTTNHSEIYTATESKLYTFEISSYYRKDQFIINGYDTGCIRTQSGIENNEPFIYEMDLQAGEEISIEVNECTALDNIWKIIIK